MNIKLYKVYGVLAHEKRPVLSELMPADGKSIEEITVEMPEDIEIYEAVDGNHILNLSGTSRRLNEVLSYRDDSPCIRWFDHGNHLKMLKVIK